MPSVRHLGLECRLFRHGLECRTVQQLGLDLRVQPHPLAITILILGARDYRIIYITQCTCTYMRNLLGDDSNLWVCRSEALLVRNVKISAFTTVPRPFAPSSSHPPARFVGILVPGCGPARLVCEKRQCRYHCLRKGTFEYNATT